MSQINDEFMEAYKRIDKFCKETFGTEKGVTSYIDEMREKTDGYKYVSYWKGTLDCLVKYRHLRNNYSHEVGSSYSDICEMNDVYWLRKFYEKLISAEDPLSLYKKAKDQKQSNLASNTKKTKTKEDIIERNKPIEEYKKKKTKSAFRVILILIILIALTVLAIDIALMIL